ncbi:hypothetical protein FB45DRAFT_897473 [Roridomyces roridus]|uniref:RRM domain-containing protein n=1 Tax=Roridomyces roridus TaxID=1738132 RepID=A0AAD7FYJ4_9AGAR|nr:hypothetical protein FB45DRAFT_897473 [Roridomyces roridus]
MSYTVHVANIAESTKEEHVKSFFEFCGKINEIEFTPPTAKIHFEKSSAAKTALMLHTGTLDGNALTVTSEVDHQDDAHDADATHPIDQSDKPRAGIAAEYLAKGYVLSDQILNRAIEMDNKQGISKRFLTYIQSVDTTVGSKALGPDKTISGKVTETIQQVRAVDEQKGYSKSAQEYYSWALSSPFGSRVRDFYTQTSKQALDIHEEAKRIATAQKPAPATST